jgi:hypothetical protein
MKVRVKDIAQLTSRASVWLVNGRIGYYTFLYCDTSPPPVQITGEKWRYIKAGCSNEQIAKLWQAAIDNYIITEGEL